MCGIIGVTGVSDAAPLLVEGLKRLEYRGYDSAGVAVHGKAGLERRRAQGKLKNLEAMLGNEPAHGGSGIGHTRWATHGVPNVINAHPHSNDRVAVVHNGIIENFAELRSELEAKGHRFETETDTETVVHLITSYLDQQMSPKEAVAQSLKRLDGAFALAIIFDGHDGLIIAARRGSPLAIGHGEGAMYLGSDAMALAPLTRQISYLDEGDWAVITANNVEIFNEDDQPVERAVKTTEMTGAMIGKGEYRHFMEKEIHEQPSVIGETLLRNLNQQNQSIALPDLAIDFASMDRLSIVACGTAYYAGLVSKYWFEDLARLPVETDIASEFRYRQPPLSPKQGAIFISQSGETIDTLEALRYVRQNDVSVLSVVNVPESSIARESDQVLQTLAGPEIGVASTKAFTTQLSVLALLAIYAGQVRGQLETKAAEQLMQQLVEVPMLCQDVLSQDAQFEAIAQEIAGARDVLYLGRNAMFPIALEGALKLKEISYIHAEGYAAGELKHGPIALIDESVPVVVCAPSSDPLIFDKTASNVEEVVARGGKVVLFTDAPGAERLANKAVSTVVMPTVDSFVAPILYALPVQMLAYHTASIMGTDVDQPRNLAKSVTVE